MLNHFTQTNAQATAESYTSTLLAISAISSNDTLEYVATSLPVVTQHSRSFFIAQHDGETDSRTTADFSGNAPASKDDDDNDADPYDEDVDEDDAVLLASMKGGGSKRRGDGTLKAGPAHDTHVCHYFFFVKGALTSHTVWLPRTQPGDHRVVS